MTTTLSFPAVAGRTYTLTSIDISANYGNLTPAAEPGRQTITVDIGGTVLFRGTTQPLAGYTTLNTSAVAAPGPQTTFPTNGATYTAATTGIVTVKFVMEIWPRNRRANPLPAWNEADDDIVFYRPTLVCR